MPAPTILSFFRPVAPRQRPAPPVDKPETVEQPKVEPSVATDKQDQQDQQQQRSTQEEAAAVDEAVPAPTESPDDANHWENEAQEATEAPGNGVSEYEQKRLARMAENARFLAQMGMKDTQLALVMETQGGSQTKDKPAMGRRTLAKRKRMASAHEVVLRRSSRLRLSPADAGDSTPKPEQKDDVEAQDDVEMLDAFFDDSSVLRYTCQARAGAVNTGTTENDAGQAAERSLVGFEREEHRKMPSLVDPKLKKVYAVSFSPFADNGLVVSAGHQGHVSVYAARSPSPSLASKERGPLLSFKAHKGWISSVSLAKSSPGGQRNLLLTASNDGLVKLWDLNQVTSISGSKPSSMPKMAFETDKLHTAGIFSMDVLADSVATCSKDSSIVISKFRDGDSLQVTHRYENQHTGVVKSVNFSRPKPQQVATGGNDRVLRVFDTNVKDRAVIQVENAHARAISSVQFHPTDANLVATAGFDADMHLFDLRRASTPLFTFRGHSVDGKQQSVIYHPVFVDNGRGLAAAAGSQCRHISLYNVYDGRTISRGAVPYRPDLLAVDPFDDRLLVVSGGAMEFYKFTWK